MKIILASTSPRRKELLKKLGLNFTVVNSCFDESLIKYDNNPIEYCQSLAFNKANNIAHQYKNKIIIGADTIVILKNKLFPKPSTKKQASLFLKKLSNNTHQVFTGISFIKNNKNIIFYESTDVTFKNLSKEEIQYYIDNYNSLDKSGAYGIQDWSSVFIKNINGCYFNVVGFPISKIYKNLKAFSPKIIENLLVKKI